ncbi:hypothetical protein LEMLEM_LOCUS10656, partial [Lemmus lemmus]
FTDKPANLIVVGPESQSTLTGLSLGRTRRQKDQHPYLRVCNRFRLEETSWPCTRSPRTVMPVRARAKDR